MIAASRAASPARRPARPIRRLAAALASGSLVAAFLFAAEPAAWGWGRVGHHVAGRIADARLTPNARRAVRELLEAGESLSSISTWADEVRNDRKESSTWHYVNVPITEAKYDRKYEDAKGGVVSKIADFRKILADPGAPRARRQEALKFLAHFLQDMHQPVHVGHRDDRGGNDLQVQYFEKGSNLHRVWDSGLLEQAGRSEQDYAQVLEARITPELAAEWSRGTVEDWANESLAAAKQAYLVPGSTAALRKGAKLGQAYYDAHLPTAELRIEQAGVRLAALLNAIWP